ncbi:hypothetical protein V8C37DRAFT_296502 [Trichoderma ceciliae]
MQNNAASCTEKHGSGVQSSFTHDETRPPKSHKAFESYGNQPTFNRERVAKNTADNRERINLEKRIIRKMETHIDKYLSSADMEERIRISSMNSRERDMEDRIRRDVTTFLKQSCSDMMLQTKEVIIAQLENKYEGIKDDYIDVREDFRKMRHKNKNMEDGYQKMEDGYHKMEGGYQKMQDGYQKIKDDHEKIKNDIQHILSLILSEFRRTEERK